MAFAALFCQNLLPQRADADADSKQAESKALWKWAVATLPELGRLQPAPRFSIHDWVGSAGSITLFIDARKRWPHAPAECVPLTFHRSEGRLAVDVPERFGQRAGATGVYTQTLVIGDDESILGSFRKLPHGGVTAIGDGWFGDKSLRTRSRDVLRFDGESFTVDVSCPVVNIARDVRCPACMRCAGFTIQRTFKKGARAARAGGGTFHRSGGPLTCEPCPDDERVPLLPRLNLALRNRLFVQKADGGSAYFRDRAACEKELLATK